MAAAAAVLAATPAPSFLRETLLMSPRVPSLQLSAEALFRPRHATEQHGSRGTTISVHRRSLWDSSSSSSPSYRGPSSEAAAVASSSSSNGLSSSGRDRGACCGIGISAMASACSVSISRSSGSCNHNAAAEHLGWRTNSCSGELMRLDVSGFSATRRKNPAFTVPRRLPLRIAAEKPDLTNVAGTLLRLGKQGLEAGTKLVPEAVPRPLAQAGVGLAGVLLASFLLRSVLSTVTFILAIGALSYAAYFFLTKGESGSSSGKGGDGPSGKPKSTDEALEEARRIMEKYK